MLAGLARKIGVVLAGVTALPWLLFVIGFGLAALNFSGIPAAQGSVFFPHFIISLLGIPTIVLGVVHALGVSGSVAKIIGTITTFFSILFLLCLGMILYFNGIALISSSVSVSIRSSSVFHALNLQFAGALLATLSWTSQMMVWTFYEVPEAGSSSSSDKPV
ncbi:uncharacterized protein LOC135337027 [Halichondria panicea]|uniref:uncharacterized protein LOC135337027 n=1 Tax=Halichondria panicea TaxID=6063 RepID=UPI00312BB7A1